LDVPLAVPIRPPCSQPQCNYRTQSSDSPFRLRGANAGFASCKIPIEEILGPLRCGEINKDHGGDEHVEQDRRRHKTQIGGYRGQRQ